MGALFTLGVSGSGLGLGSGSEPGGIEALSACLSAHTRKALSSTTISSAITLCPYPLLPGHFPSNATTVLLRCKWAGEFNKRRKECGC